MFKSLVSIACIAVIAIAGLLFWQEKQKADARAHYAKVVACDALADRAALAAKEAGHQEPHPFRFTGHPLHEKTAKCIAERLITAIDWSRLSAGQKFTPMTRRES